MIFRQPGGQHDGPAIGAEAAPVLLDVDEVARRLGTKPRFVRRLIAERRIEYHKVGRHVRISEAALDDVHRGGPGRR